VTCRILKAVCTPIVIAAVAALLAACASTREATAPDRSKLEVVDTLTLPIGKTFSDFERDSTIVTRRDGDTNVAEYRLKGQLYKMVVTPDKSPAYTLVDEKGDGKFVRAGAQTANIVVPMWVLLRW
jgi:Protein of unknown function (DUF2782)